MTWWLCISTKIVPNFLPRRKAKSSIPSSDTCSTGAVGSAMILRRMVIQFRVIVDGCIETCSIADFPSAFYEAHPHCFPHVEERRSHYDKPLQPGQRQSYPYHLGEVCTAMRSLRSRVFLDEIQVVDRIGNTSGESIAPGMRRSLQQFETRYYPSAPSSFVEEGDEQG